MSDGVDFNAAKLPAGVERLPAREGLALLRLHGAGGSHADIAVQGAQVLSWRDASGRERLYLSPRARFSPGQAIRGGVPVVFPQFSGRGALPKHGFVRGLDWRFDGASIDASSSRLVLVLQDNAVTRALWPHAFGLRLEVVLGAQSLDVTLQVHNRGTAPFAFTAALHSYLAVETIDRVELHGLSGRPFEDAAGGGDWRVQSEAALRFEGETDRVFPEVHAPLTLAEGEHRLQISAAGFPDVVVWNPGTDLAGSLADLGSEQAARFACVEAACVLKPVLLPPGGTWQGGQRLASG